MARAKVFPAQDGKTEVKTMAKQQSIERITITVPRRMAEEIALRVDFGTYASVSEWIRYAMREQLARESDQVEQAIRRKPELAASIADAREGKVMRGSPSDIGE